MPRPALVLWMLLAALCGAIRVDASEYRETNDFADAVIAAEAYAETYSPEETLLVVDIDNTLLTMHGDLGSDPWFEWQEYLLNHEPESRHLVADDFGGLLKAQGLLFQLGKMCPPQKNLPELLNRCQGLGVKTLVLTSRGPDFRPATERELKAAGYDFKRSTLAMADVPAGDFLPYDPERPEEVGLLPEDLDRYALRAPRLTSLKNGIFMTSGQHKGAMLLTALHRATEKIKAVVFIDDHGRHVHRVYDTLNRRGLDVTVLHYKREDDNVARFRYGNKDDVTRRWHRLQSTINEVFALPKKRHPVKQATLEEPAEPAGG